MRELEKLKVDYMGHESPLTPDEVGLEILGLKLAITSAKQRIALLEQGLKVAEMRDYSIRVQRAKEQEENKPEETKTE